MSATVVVVVETGVVDVVDGKSVVDCVGSVTMDNVGPDSVVVMTPVVVDVDVPATAVVVV